jgi:hypothetical protein
LYRRQTTTYNSGVGDCLGGKEGQQENLRELGQADAARRDTELKKLAKDPLGHDSASWAELNDTVDGIMFGAAGLPQDSL